MAVFKFKGKNIAGTIVSGERPGKTKQEVIAGLEKDQIQILEIEKKKTEIPIPFIKKGALFCLDIK